MGKYKNVVATLDLTELGSSTVLGGGGLGEGGAWSPGHRAQGMALCQGLLQAANPALASVPPSPEWELGLGT